MPISVAGARLLAARMAAAGESREAAEQRLAAAVPDEVLADILAETF